MKLKRHALDPQVECPWCLNAQLEFRGSADDGDLYACGWCSNVCLHGETAGGCGLSRIDQGELLPAPRSCVPPGLREPAPPAGLGVAAASGDPDGDPLDDDDEAPAARLQGEARCCPRLNRRGGGVWALIRTSYWPGRWRTKPVRATSQDEGAARAERTRIPTRRPSSFTAAKRLDKVCAC